MQSRFVSNGAILQSILSQSYCNLITNKIENLSHCTKLQFLDVSNNELSEISDLSTSESLEVLKLANNKLTTPSTFISVASIPKLQELDISSNKIDGSYEGILNVISQCKCLKSLSLKGNPITKSMPHYRKMVICRCPRLTSLDGKRVCSEERRRCDVWGKVVSCGGTFEEANEADRQELNNIRSEQSSDNAIHRYDSRTGHDVSINAKSISSSVLNGIKNTFGIIDTKRYPTSTISWSYVDPDGSIEVKRARKSNSSEAQPVEAFSSMKDKCNAPGWTSSTGGASCKRSSIASNMHSSTSSDSGWSKVPPEESFEYNETVFHPTFSLLPPPPPPPCSIN
eukprot:scaffold1094_cov185-Alexandrium_tamarense.AAC.4